MASKGTFMSLVSRTRCQWRHCRSLALVVGLLLAAATAAHAEEMHYMERAPIRDPNYIIRYHIWSYKELKERQIVMQKQDYSCGAAALATIVRYYWGDNVGEEKFLNILLQIRTEAELRDRVQNGLTLTDLRDIARKAGYEATMGKVGFGELAEAKVPVIVGITIRGHDHYAVFRGTDWSWAYLADPIRGNIRVPCNEFVGMWQKNAILVVAKPNTEVKKYNPMGIRQSEMDRGILNDFYMNKDGLMPIPVNPLKISP